MQRTTQSFPIAQGQLNNLKQKMLSWCNQFGIFLFLDSNHYVSPYSSYACLLAVHKNAQNAIALKNLAEVAVYHQQTSDWLFGHINYDYKNELESRLTSNHEAKFKFEDLSFFCPDIVCYINTQHTSLTIECLHTSPQEVYAAINAVNITPSTLLPKLSFQQKIDKRKYIQTIEQLRKHIAQGDCYELNFCCEGFANIPNLDTLSVFNRLNKLSPAPFAAYYRLHHQYMMCASPERYLKKNAKQIIAQPIKGTIRRSENIDEDNLLKTTLKNSTKDRAENVMIVDLMRNDLAHSCALGSINVDELFGIYTFPQVHQMISTVSGKLEENRAFTDAIQYAFPMGSMTGAPKIKVMELIEQYEQSRRELFSGTVGYITPLGNFDFNVIIRSLFYNAQCNYLSYQTGGAITYDSDAQQEYEEMRLKAWALERVFGM